MNSCLRTALPCETTEDRSFDPICICGSVGPIFDGVVARLDAMRTRGDVKKDVDARHLVLSCVAMVAFPFQEEPFVKAIWPADWHGEAFLEERKKHNVAMILARVAP